MLDRLLAPFFAQLALKVGWIITLWIGLLLAAAAIFSRGRLRDFLSSLGQLVAAVVTSPFAYLRKAVLALCDYGRRGNAVFGGTDQFLLSRLVVFLDAGVVLLSLGVLAGGIVESFEVLVPPAEVREALARTEEALVQQMRRLEETKRQVSDLDKAWTAEGAKIEKAFREPREKVQRAEKQVRARIESQIVPETPLSSAIEAAKQAITNQGEPDSETAAAYTRNSARSWLWYLDGPGQEALTSWTESWYREAIASIELREVSAESLRAQKQPNYGQLSAEKSDLESQIQATTTSRDELRREARLRFGPAFRQLVMAAVSLLALVWWLGLLLEALGLALHLTNDVRRLREKIVIEEGVLVVQVPTPEG